ncbi:MAG: DUF5985 family protein [Myxococcota bacterium]
MIAELIYLLCTLTSILCAVLLIRSYRRTRTVLLLWSSLCFVGLALNNMLLFTDLYIVPHIDLELWRTSTGLVSLSLLLFGLVWEAR